MVRFTAWYLPNTFSSADEISPSVARTPRRLHRQFQQVARARLRARWSAPPALRPPRR